MLVSGRVQGVFFRDGCQQEAQRLGVAGWVRNRDDGRVEAVFEGNDAAIGSVVDWCRQGPSSAEVDALDVTDERPEGLRGFEVR